MHRAFVAAAVTCSILAGCSGAPSTGGALPEQLHALSPQASPSGRLYVANASSVTVYLPNETKVYRTITSGIKVPHSLAIDPSNDLYVANEKGGSGSGSVTEYAPGKTTEKRTITKGISDPVALTIDKNGNVYVLNGSGGKNDVGSVTVYSPSSETPTLTITAGIGHPTGSQAIALDAQNDVYVANASSVTAYAPGSTKVLRSFTSNVSKPIQVDIDFLGGVNVVNSTGNVTLFSLSDGALLNTLVVPTPCCMLFANPGGDIIVADPNGVSGAYTGGLYAFGPYGNLLGIYTENGVNYPSAMAVNSSLHYLYVLNHSSAAGASPRINVYQIASVPPQKTGTVITAGLDKPVTMVVNP